VVQQVLPGAVARNDGLRAVAEHRQHGQAPVLQLLRLELLQLLLVLAQVEQVEELAACAGCAPKRNTQVLCSVLASFTTQ
jgi:hypothetical protein